MWPDSKIVGPLLASGCLLLLCLPVSLSDSTSTVTTFLSAADRGRLKQVFNSAWALKELSAVHYAVLGYKLLGEPLPDSNGICKYLVDSSSGTPTAEVSYYVSTAWKAIGNCPGTLPAPAITKSASGILDKESSSVSDIYYAVHSLKSLGQPLTQSAKIVKTLQAALKKDDSISNLGYCLHIASQMGAEGAFAFDRVEDAVVQADEVDGKYLQFEGGLSITALLVSGAYNLASSLNKTPSITGDQAVKFSNYFLSRRSVQTPKGAYSLINVVNILSNNKLHVPVVLTMLGGGAVSGEQPRLQVRVSDLLGRALPVMPLSLTVESAVRQADSVVIISKKKFEQSTTDKTVYSVGLLETKPEPGVYRVSVSALPPGAEGRLVGNVGVPLTVKVMATVTPQPVQVATSDADQTTQPKFISVKYPAKLEEILEGDTVQKLVVKFGLVDKLTGKAVAVHQAFVRLVHSKTGQDVIFVADRDPTTNNYRLDLDIGAKAGEFGHLSGVYRVEMIVGDVILSNSFSWHLADIKLKLGYESPLEPDDPVHPIYRPRPEIQHLFREPEKRPPAFVSNLFTGLVLLPLLFLLAMWFKLGVNISNFPFSLSAIGFHLGLGAIFGLFGMFWFQLNMFETLKYLLGLGVVTFLCGNKLLTKIAAARKSAP